MFSSKPWHTQVYVWIQSGLTWLSQHSLKASEQRLMTCSCTKLPDIILHNIQQYDLPMTRSGKHDQATNTLDSKYTDTMLGLQRI
jgi:hypothetical protein